MTGSPGEGWKVFADGDEADDIPLWKVLAKVRSDNLDEGLSANAAFLDRIRPAPSRYYNLALVISIVFGFLAVLFLIGLLISVRTGATDLFYFLTVAMVAAAVAPQLWRQAYQYGLSTPDRPLALPHASDPLFDAVLVHLQKVDGPQAYYRSWFRRKRIPLKRRQFFGRLRYFLFSEHGKDRGLVMRFPTAMALPADIYLHREDVDKILAVDRPKRKGGPGRNAKYRYEEAIIALLGDPRPEALDVSDRAAAIQTIKDWLSEWFEANADESGDVPRRDQLTPFAEKIYTHLERAASAKAR
ncbi:hypothetical protein [Novosphingobium sp. KACC 22771]|uniref:hypothetical protein n=1 Tax=Novosphingobium sp. KACC 22771 TaxID=3025670 RepID=UPI0023655574|nr:hypothetical protein [Novosphingobium sp. KACC 22771]WDF73606.1 hypothetical protein PQ467_06085 [Novosphingobium sp. KACC 22771]